MRAAASSGDQGFAQPKETAPNRILTTTLWMVVIIPVLTAASNVMLQELAVRILHLLVAVLTGLLVLNSRWGVSRERFAAFLGTGPNLPILLYLVVTALSILLLPHEPAIRKLGFYKVMSILAGVLLYFSVAYHIRRSQDIARVAETLAFVSSLMAILGLGLIVSQETANRAEVFGNSQLFGGFLMILLPIPAVLSVTETDSRRRTIALIASSLICIGLIMSGTRSTWISALVMIVTMGLLSQIRPRGARLDSSTRAQAIIAVITVLSCFLLAAFQGDVYQAIQRRVSAGGSSMQERQSQHWYAAQQLTLYNPMLGLGPATYPIYQYAYSQAGRPGDMVLAARASLYENAHNIWLQTAAEQGLLGVGLFAAILLTFLAAGLRRLRRLAGGIHRSMLIACMASVVGFVVDGFSNPCWEFPHIALFLWLVLGLGVSCLQSRRTLA